MDLGVVMASAIGVLSILVMLLMGWQIYNLIDIRKLKKEIEEKRQHVVWEAEHNMLLSSMALSDFYYSSVTDEPIKDKHFKYLHYRIAAMLHASRIADYETCNVTTRFLLETITAELRLSGQDKQYLLDLLLKITSPSEIQDFRGLLKRVLSIPEN